MEGVVNRPSGKSIDEGIFCPTEYYTQSINTVGAISSFLCARFPHLPVSTSAWVMYNQLNVHDDCMKSPMVVISVPTTEVRQTLKNWKLPMNNSLKHFAVTTDSIAVVADVLDDADVISIIWLRTDDEVDQIDLLSTSQQVLELLQERVQADTASLNGYVILPFARNALGVKEYRNFGLAFSSIFSDEIEDLFVQLEKDTARCPWWLEVGVHRQWEHFKASEVLQYVREMDYENQYAPRKIYEQAKQIEMFHFFDSRLVPSTAGLLAYELGAKPLIDGLSVAGVEHRRWHPLPQSSE